MKAKAKTPTPVCSTCGQKLKKGIEVKLQLMKIGEHKGVHYLTQKYGNMFQWIIFYKDNFYQGHMIITPRPGAIEHTEEDLTGIVSVILDAAETTIETLLMRDDPDYKPTEQEEAQYAEGEMVSDVLEQINKGKGTEENPVELELPDPNQTVN